MRNFMQTLINEYNGKHATEVTPKINSYVSNDMTSVYYFTWQGEQQYVDQYDLQESFDYDGRDTWDTATISDKALALAELVQAQTVGL